MTVRQAFVVALLAAALVLSATAFASTATVSPSTTATYTAPTPAVPSTATASPPKPAKPVKPTPKMTYDLTWTLPAAGKSGCTVCHSDPDLVKVVAGQTVSLYVNTELLDLSAQTACLAQAAMWTSRTRRRTPT